MRQARQQENLHRLAAHRDALANLLDEIEAFHSELIFFRMDTIVLAEHPAAAANTGLLDAIEALAQRIAAKAGRIAALEDRLGVTQACAEAALARHAVLPLALN